MGFPLDVFEGGRVCREINRQTLVVVVGVYLKIHKCQVAGGKKMSYTIVSGKKCKALCSSA